MKKLLLATSVLAVLAGCSSAPRVPEYSCALNVSEKGKCASVQEALAASKTAKVSPGTQSVFDAQAQQAQQAAAQPYFGGNVGAAPLGYTDAAPTNGAPVFNQPKVYRPWVAPYTDADGVLRSGQYVYFNTPGNWNYGSLKKKGAGSDIFAPANPKEKLGFTPDYNAQQQSAQKPPKPATSNTQQIINSTKQAADVTTPEGITQPKQRFNQ